MGTFFKTFFFCLILSLAFLGYKLLGNDSYNTDLFVSKNSSVFGLHPDEPEKKNENQPENKTALQTKNNKYEHICYFYSQGGKLQKTTRELSFEPSVEHAVTLLLKGPYIAETKKGVYSEIPVNVDLIGIKRENNTIIVNLSSNFGNGGGTQSVNNRIAQLSKTVKYLEPNKKIYLYIEGKEVEYLGGDGVYVKQPLD